MQGVSKWVDDEEGVGPGDAIAQRTFAGAPGRISEITAPKTLQVIDSYLVVAMK